MDSIHPFIANHQMNLIKKQIEKLQYAIEHSSDNRVIEALKYSVETTILSSIGGLSDAHKQLLLSYEGLSNQEQFSQYLERLSLYTIAFPAITEQHLKKLFPKSKKLKAPSMEETNNPNLTYLGWRDIATNKYMIVYSSNNQFVGIEGNLSSVNKHNVCSICNTPGSPEAIGYLSIVCKPPAQASPDYYKAIGNYVCLDSAHCNRELTDLSYMEYIVQQANNKWLSLG